MKVQWQVTCIEDHVADAASQDRRDTDLVTEGELRWHQTVARPQDSSFNYVSQDEIVYSQVSVVQIFKCQRVPIKVENHVVSLLRSVGQEFVDTRKMSKP